MSPASIANLERTMRAFLALVTALERIGEDPEFAHVFVLAAVHGQQYQGPTWERELLEAQECLREARTLVAGPGSADPEILRAAISPRADR